jgi:two-component system LytT family sensor kinase
MVRNVLVKDLIRYSWMVALVLGAFAFVFVHIFNVGSLPSSFFSFFVAIRVFVQGLANVATIIIVQRFLPAATEGRKKLIRYAIGYLFAFVFFLSSDPLETFLSVPDAGPWVFSQRLPSILLEAFIHNTITIIVQNFVILRYEKANAVLENSRLREANLESANQLLKQQIHPHFLFNALSMLKSLYKTDVKAGEAYLSHLVNFLRASLAEPQSRVSSLQDEIELCHDYVEMQKIRFEDALICRIDIPESVRLRGAVPPFSVQSLIENAIKHNEVTEASPLDIKIFYEDGRIHVENNLQVRAYVDSHSGKGLINLMERYKILASEEVIIRQDTRIFSVSIKVLLHEDSDHRG